MCGIVGVTGSKRVLAILTSGMARLEYRGYDSAGIACTEIESGGHQGAASLLWRKRTCVGTNSVARLTAELGDKELGDGNCCQLAGIGHVRWATHGRPDIDNAHPHFDCNSEIAVVHNGIVENYESIKSQLVDEGHKFTSETDSEVIAHLLESFSSSTKEPIKALKALLDVLEGTFAIAVLFKHLPSDIYVVRRVSPLIVGLHNGIGLVASDIPAILGETRQVYSLSDNEIAIVRPDSISIVGEDGEVSDPIFRDIQWSLEEAEKGGFDDFMSKEIAEQPASVADTLRGRITEDGTILLDQENLSKDQLREIDKIFIVACGSSFHAGLVAKYAIEHWARVPVEVDISSEFRYRDPILNSRTLVVGVSQSGETIDTFQALKEARLQGAKVLVITNVVDSSMTRECDAVLYTRAGPELGVAATKTHVAQMAALYLLAIHIAQSKNVLYPEESLEIVNHLRQVPDLMAKTISLQSNIADLVHRLSNQTTGDAQPTGNRCRRFFYLGRNVGYPVALEGALKLKEISYLAAEGYPAGELKHGPISLIEPGVIVVAIATRNRLWSKMLANIEEVKARGATVVIVAGEGDEESIAKADEVILVPRVPHPLLAPMIDVIALQLFAYHFALVMGNDVDRPRNLAKTVTVE